MKSLKYFMASYFVCLLIVTTPLLQREAKGGVIYSLIVGLSTEITQLANLGELAGINVSTWTEVIQQVRQLEHEVTMIQNLIQNTERLINDPLASVNSLEALAKVIEKGQILNFVANNLDDKFAEQYPGYEEYRSEDINSQFLHEKYQAWTETNTDNIKAALNAAHIQQDTILSERTRIQTFRSQSETSEGRLKVLQAGNRLAAQQGESLLSLRELIATNMQLQANYMAENQDSADVNRAKWEQASKSEVPVIGDESSITGGIK